MKNGKKEKGKKEKKQEKRREEKMRKETKGKNYHQFWPHDKLAALDYICLIH